MQPCFLHFHLPKTSVWMLVAFFHASSGKSFARMNKTHSHNNFPHTKFNTSFFLFLLMQMITLGFCLPDLGLSTEDASFWPPFPIKPKDYFSYSILTFLEKNKTPFCSFFVRLTLVVWLCRRSNLAHF